MWGASPAETTVSGDHLLEGLQGVGFQAGEVGDVLLQPLAAQLGGGGRGGDLRGGLGARAEALFPGRLPAAGGRPAGRCGYTGPGALHGPDLVAADGEQIDPQPLGGKGDFRNPCTASV